MKVTDPKALAVYLRDERKRRGLSQSVVADEVDLRQGTVSRFESTPEKMQLDTLFRLLSALELELSVKPRDGSARNQRGSHTSDDGKWTEEW
ncbi:helix-turn-helix domain-containing protein [Idiomarina sp. HP20-50]|uniref:helix-turn-helix domain-containing protein n=1 Tax=Idiomarina sp. HP20-50 TaxID=3070813 RepID=UPI00294B331D|nr:helix-turn-helix domain-containing protein [Idiomarina sp. HP20-50]MDV6316458.1 helix-turn-helix domain-containing protein [Idiomarina sp. HP20-50]